MSFRASISTHSIFRMTCSKAFGVGCRALPPVCADGVAYLLFASESAFESPDDLVYVDIELIDTGPGPEALGAR